MVSLVFQGEISVAIRKSYLTVYANNVDPDQFLESGFTFCISCKLVYHLTWLNQSYAKCPKILYTKVSDKMTYANSADPDQTEGAL